MDFVDSSVRAQLILTRSQYDEMLHDVYLHEKEEACGIIGGRGTAAFKVYPITNSLHSPTRFRMDASEQVKALIEIEKNGWELLAIYHSHLRGPNKPSETDTKEFAYPGVIYLIFDLSESHHLLRGYQMITGNWTEIPIIISN